MVSDWVGVGIMVEFKFGAKHNLLERSLYSLWPEFYFSVIGKSFLTF